MFSAFFAKISLGGLVLLCFVLASCGDWSQTEAPAKIYYTPNGKHSAKLVNGRVIAPKDAPIQVKRAVAAANKISGYPYRRGGGHAKHIDSAYDCSGSASFVLKEAGFLTKSRNSSGFLDYGSRGMGDWITVYTKRGHTFLVICGVRFDTGGGNGQRDRGPKWQTTARSGVGFYMRHPNYF